MSDVGSVFSPYLTLISLVLLTKSMTPILDFLPREVVRQVPLVRNICGQWFKNCSCSKFSPKCSCTCAPLFGFFVLTHSNYVILALSEENNVHLWTWRLKPLTGEVRNNWMLCGKSGSWHLHVEGSTHTTHQNSVAVPDPGVGVMAGGADGGFSLYVSGKPAAPGQHWVQRPRPEGAAAAWQGMNQITLLFLSAARRPSLSAPHRPCVALYTIIHLGIPVFSKPRSFLPWRKGCVFFLSGLCEGGNPDECHQEKPAAAPPLSGKLTRHPAPTFKTVRPIGRLLLAFSASLCEPGGRGFPVCVQAELLRAGFPGRMFLTAHFLIVLCWHNRANTGYVCTRVHLWTFITLILPITY